MRLYLLRHGHAPSTGEAGVASDAERPLSERGRKDVRAAIEELRRRGGRPALILHSPLRRAEQTAREAAALLQPATGTRIFMGLANTLPAGDLLSELRPHAEKAGELLAIGHQPQLGELVALLAGRTLELRPAGLIALELDGQGASLLWSHQPDAA